MRFLRVGAIILFSIAVVLTAAVAAILHNQSRLISFVLQRIQQSTGYVIITANSRLRFGTHLSVVLDRPSIQHDGRELARSDRVRVYLSYHALIWNNGLPLRAVVVVRPEVRIPVSENSLGANLLPRPDGPAIRAVAKEFREFTGLVERVTIANAGVSDASGKPLLEELSLTAAPQRRHAKTWTVGFIAPRVHTDLSGLEISGRMNINTDLLTAGQIVSAGELWFWNGRLDRDAGGGVKLNGMAHGEARFGLDLNGVLSGRGEFAVDKFIASGQRLDKPIDLGNCSVTGEFVVSSDRVALSKVEIGTRKGTVASADVALSAPFASNASVLAHISAPQIDLAELKAQLDKIRALPSTLSSIAAALNSGHVIVEGATFGSELKKAELSTAAIEQGLSVSARFEGLSLKISSAAALPELSQASAQLTYAKGRLTVAQGSAVMGRSSFQEFSGSADFLSRKEIRYQVKATGALDLDELYPAAIRMSPELAAKLQGHVDRLSGQVPVQVTASGNLDIDSPGIPAKFLAKIDTRLLTLSDKDLPLPITLTEGAVTLTPGKIELRHVIAAVAKPNEPGNVGVDGDLVFDSGGIRLERIAVDLHQVKVEDWLPLVIDPQDIAARGPIGGALTIMRAPGHKGGVRANGRVTLGGGEVQLGFLRAPIVAESATLTFDGRGLLLAILGAKLQGAPLDFSLGVEDLDRPELRIVANSGRLDLEVMKFIRVPWAPSPPAHFFPVPVTGRIEANHANFERLLMSHVACDFRREVNGDWNVQNFSTNMYSGHADMELSGRGRDDWINMKGHLVGVQVAPLFALSNPAAEPPLSGRLEAKGDLWANSDTNFFDTLAGTINVKITDGVLHKFALLSSILSYLDLKTWLSAQVPDPRVHGVPFQTLTADFKGRGGDFYSDNLLLRGPIMNISALGHMRLGDGNVDMEVGMVPFKTVNWLMAKVPLIGEGLSTDHFVAAYFHVTGPLSNPRVVPKPITSVAYFLTNVIKVPYNILKGMGNNGGNGN